MGNYSKEDREFRNKWRKKLFDKMKRGLYCGGELELEAVKDPDDDDKVVLRVAKADVEIDGYDDANIGASIDVSAVEFWAENLENRYIERATINALKCEAGASVSLGRDGLGFESGAMLSIMDVDVEGKTHNIGDRISIDWSGKLKVGAVGGKLKAELEKGHELEGKTLSFTLGLAGAIGGEISIEITFK